MSEAKNDRPIYAMAQPIALPGSCCYRGESIDYISDRLLQELSLLEQAGIDGVILQNFSDNPIKQQSSPEVIGFLTRIACDIKKEYPNLVLGILVCWDGLASLMVAEAAGADFIRVEHVYCGAEMTHAGIIEGQCAEIQALKYKLRSSMPIYADVFEPHAVPIFPHTIEDAAYDTIVSGLADGLYLCGKTAEESINYVQRVRAVLPSTRIICGGGSNADNVGRLLKEFDGVCIGTWIKNGNLRNPVDLERLARYMDAVNAARL